MVVHPSHGVLVPGHRQQLPAVCRGQSVAQVFQTADQHPRDHQLAEHAQRPSHGASTHVHSR